jgi:hypothetical protein
MLLFEVTDLVPGGRMYYPLPSEIEAILAYHSVTNVHVAG